MKTPQQSFAQKMEAMRLELQRVAYSTAIAVVSEEIWQRCSAETKIWFAAMPGVPRLDLRVLTPHPSPLPDRGGEGEADASRFHLEELQKIQDYVAQRTPKDRI